MKSKNQFPMLKDFFNSLEAVEKPLYEGYEMSFLKVVAHLTNVKFEYNLPH